MSAQSKNICLMSAYTGGCGAFCDGCMCARCQRWLQPAACWCTQLIVRLVCGQAELLGGV